jgi:hypothetical protein
MTEYVSVKGLPTSVQSALSGLGYGSKDIEVITADSVSMSGAGGNGRRDFVTLINLSTDASETHWGSWGGQNMFNPTNAVDNDDRSYPLPLNGLIVKGSVGGGRPVHARIYVSADMAPKVITAGPAETLTAQQVEALRIFKSYKSSYRTDYLRRAGIGDDIIAGLVASGHLSQNKAGARQITTLGKNAAIANLTL